MKITLSLEVSDDDLIAIDNARTGNNDDCKASREQAKAFLESQGPVIVGDLLRRPEESEAA